MLRALYQNLRFENKSGDDMVELKEEPLSKRDDFKSFSPKSLQ